MRANRVQATVGVYVGEGSLTKSWFSAAEVKIGGREQCHPKTAFLKKAVRLSTLYVNKRGNKKTLQTIHKPYI